MTHRDDPLSTSEHFEQPAAQEDKQGVHFPTLKKVKGEREPPCLITNKPSEMLTDQHIASRCSDANPEHELVPVDDAWLSTETAVDNDGHNNGGEWCQFDNAPPTTYSELAVGSRRLPTRCRLPPTTYSLADKYG